MPPTPDVIAATLAQRILSRFAAPGPQGIIAAPARAIANLCTAVRLFMPTGAAYQANDSILGAVRIRGGWGDSIAMIDQERVEEAHASARTLVALLPPPVPVEEALPSVVALLVEKATPTPRGYLSNVWEVQGLAGAISVLTMGTEREAEAQSLYNAIRSAVVSHQKQLSCLGASRGSATRAHEAALKLKPLFPERT